jgi:16S rRNA processing protein RimM
MSLVGFVARPHGVTGQVVVNPETDFPSERFQPGSEVYVNRAGRVEALTLETVRFHRGRPIVSIAGVGTVDAARALAGLELRVPAAKLVPLPPGTFYRHDLVGCRVETSSGETVGVVFEVSGSVEASHLVVLAGHDEILIPFTSAICTAIDPARQRIVIEPPDGLLTLNARSG